MIIRSQNKCVIENLEETEAVYIRNVDWDEYDVVTDKRFLGTYSTEEKAIKVLDMICEHYQNCEMCKCGLRQVAETEFVFQMPQDSEVSVE